MPERIYHLPFLFSAMVIRPKHRKASHEWVRDVCPVSVRLLPKAQTEPVRISVRRGDENKKLELRYDGKTCLKPVADVTDTWLHDMEAGLHPQGEFDAAAILMTRNNKRLRHYTDGYWSDLRPDQIPTEDAVRRRVRTYVSDDRNDVIAKLHHIMSRHVLVGGQLHREVPPPQWRHASDIVGIVPGELIAGMKTKDKDSGHVFWWPLSRHEDFVAHCNNHSERAVCSVTIKAPAALLAGVPFGNPVEDAQKLFKMVEHNLHWALPNLSDEALVKFGEYRRLVEQSKEGGLDTCIAAAKVLRAIADSPPHDDGGYAGGSFRDMANNQLDHWETMLRRQGLLDTSPGEDAALIAMSVA